MIDFQTRHAQVQVSTCLVTSDGKNYHEGYRVSVYDSNGVPTSTYHETLNEALEVVAASFSDIFGGKQHGAG